MGLDAGLECLRVTCSVKVVVMVINNKLNNTTDILFCYFNKRQKTPKQPEPSIRGQRSWVRCTQCV